MKTSKKVGLFFGSFNPIHVGHMIIANYIVNHSDLNEVWFVVSPHNPFKTKESLAPDRERLHMVRLSIGDNPKLRASDIEFSLPKPSYTIDTLTVLKEKYPSYQFKLIMGGDNLPTLPKWKNYDKLIADYEILVYGRPGFDLGTLKDHPHIHLVEAPLMGISSTLIRSLIKQGKSIEYLVTEPVFKYIDGSSLYN